MIRTCMHRQNDGRLTVLHLRRIFSFVTVSTSLGKTGTIATWAFAWVLGGLLDFLCKLSFSKGFCCLYICLALINSRLEAPCLRNVWTNACRPACAIRLDLDLSSFLLLLVSMRVPDCCKWYRTSFMTYICMVMSMSCKIQFHLDVMYLFINNFPFVPL